jgi:hypothetical protein
MPVQELLRSGPPFFEEKGFTGQGHAETNLDEPSVTREKRPCIQC